MGRHCPLFPTLVSFVSRSCLSLPLLGFSLLCLRSPETPPMLSGVWGAQGPRGWDNCLEYPSHLRQPLPLLIETLCHPWAQVPCPCGRGVSSPCTGPPQHWLERGFYWICGSGWGQPLEQDSQRVQGAGSTNLTSVLCCVTAAWCCPAASLEVWWV